MLYIYIKKPKYDKKDRFSDYMESPKYGEIGFCLTPACGEKEILRFIQDLLLDITMKSSVFYHIEQVRS